MATPHFLSGTEGRFKYIALTPNLALQVPVIGSPSTVAIAGITSWKVSPTLEAGGVAYDFESTASASGILAPSQIQGGLGPWTVDIEGNYDAAANPLTSSQFLLGYFCVFDLVISKGMPLTFSNCVGKIVVAPTFGPTLRNTPTTFTLKIDGHGALPTPA